MSALLERRQQHQNQEQHQQQHQQHQRRRRPPQHESAADAPTVSGTIESSRPDEQLQQQQKNWLRRLSQHAGDGTTLIGKSKRFSSRKSRRDEVMAMQHRQELLNDSMVGLTDLLERMERLAVFPSRDHGRTEAAGEEDDEEDVQQENEGISHDGQLTVSAAAVAAADHLRRQVQEANIDEKRCTCLTFDGDNDGTESIQEEEDCIVPLNDSIDTRRSTSKIIHSISTPISMTPIMVLGLDSTTSSSTSFDDTAATGDVVNHAVKSKNKVIMTGNLPKQKYQRRMTPPSITALKEELLPCQPSSSSSSRNNEMARAA